MRAPVALLDNAFDRVSALDFEVPNPFVNHAPMACEALAALGLHAAIDDWVQQFESSMRAPVQPTTPTWRRSFDWKERLGDFRLLPEWMGYFGRAIEEEGWPSVVGLWVPRLMPGLASALFHGVIRTAHAVRAIAEADSAARRAELARALGNWAAWFGPGRPAEEMRAMDDPGSAALAAAAAGARCYVTAPTIFNLHGVTGAMAVHLLCEHLSAPHGAAAATQLRAEHRSLYQGVTPMATGNVVEPWGADAVVAATASHDPHQIKLVEACHRGFVETGDRGFVVAARRVTGT
jgi:hypothetical protein